MDSDATVGDVITREYVGVSESDTVRATVGVMREERVASAVVLRGSDPVGIVTEWDVLTVVEDGLDPEETGVGEVMSAPVRTVPPETPLVDAASVMSSENIRNLVVEESGEILGVLTDRDVIAAVASLWPSTEGVASNPGAEPGAGPATPAEEAATDRLGSSASPAATDAEFSNQGVCEVCGSLTDSLNEHNGRVVCSDCAEM